MKKRIEELALREPVVLSDRSAVKKRHDRQAAAEDKRTGFQKKQEERCKRCG